MPITPADPDTVAWLRLTLVPGLGPAGQRALLRHYGSPQAVLDAPCKEVAARFGPAPAEALEKGAPQDRVERTLRWLEHPQRRLLALGEPAYPKALLTTADPPTVLYAVGRVELLDAPSLAIVGSRNATGGGMRDAEAFAREFSQAGLCVVSGMALGIDSAAHRGGLAGTGSTIAVLGTGADIVYPSRNRELAHAIAERGCLVSEFAVGTASSAGNFPRRNRLISGLSRGVLVVEAGMPSGSLITARLALEQGRDVFAVPGSIHSPLAKGCHDLIKQGAKLVENAADVLVELGWERGVARSDARCERSHPLLEAMGFAPLSVDELCGVTGLAARAIAAQLTRLQLDGRVCALPGGRFQRLAGAAAGSSEGAL